MTSPLLDRTGMTWTCADCAQRAFCVVYWEGVPEDMDRQHVLALAPMLCYDCIAKRQAKESADVAPD